MPEKPMYNFTAIAPIPSLELKIPGGSISPFIRALRVAIEAMDEERDSHRSGRRVLSEAIGVIREALRIEELLP